MHLQAACKGSSSRDQRTAEPKKVVEAIKGSDVRYTATSPPNECRVPPKLIGVRRGNTEVHNLVTCLRRAEDHKTVRIPTGSKSLMLAEI